jgi:hypothetical protein
MFPLVRLQIVIGDDLLAMGIQLERKVSINSPPNCYWRQQGFERLAITGF